MENGAWWEHDVTVTMVAVVEAATLVGGAWIS